MPGTEQSRATVDAATRDRRFQQLKVDLHEQLISGMDFAVLRSVDPAVLRDELRKGAEQFCGLHSDLLSQADRNRLIEELVDETLGLGPLEPLMHDPTISDILINGPNCVYVERRGRLERTAIRFRDHDHLFGILQRIAGRVGRRHRRIEPNGRRPPAGRQPAERGDSATGIRRGLGFDPPIFHAAA